MSPKIDPEEAINQLRTIQKMVRRINRELVVSGEIEVGSKEASTFIKFDNLLYLLVENLLRKYYAIPGQLPIEEKEP